MRRKLVYVLPEYDPETGSHLRYEYELLSELDRHCDLRVVVERGSNIDGLDTYCQRFSFPPLRLLELFAVLLLFRTDGYDVTYTHYSNYGALVSGLLSSVFGGLALFWNCGEMEEARAGDPDGFDDRLYNLKDRYTLLLSLRTTDILVTGTSIMKEYYAETYDVPRVSIRTLPNWVDRDRFAHLNERSLLREQLDLPTNRPIVLYLHRVVDHKGADMVPDIAQQVSEHIPDVLFVVVGDGPYRAQLERDIEQHDLEATVTVTGRVPNQAAVKYFGASDLYIMPSRSEGFPRVILEAMAARCPFVSTDAGGVREIVPEAYDEYIIPRNEWGVFARTVTTLLKNSDERHRLREVGWERVGEYNKRRVRSELLTIIKAEYWKQSLLLGAG